ncbi:MAG TPA: hypothetical protein VK729_06485 [Silvibacterium sp.]|nr:hypothetical protein [Silvibacterium sp.]
MPSRLLLRAGRLQSSRDSPRGSKQDNRIITIVLGVIFGTWFLFKVLAGLGLT